MNLRTSIRTPLLGALLLLAPASHATLVLSVGQENTTGGGSGTSVTDQPTLSAPLSKGFGSASLGALSSFNRTTDGNSSFINRSRWELSDIFFTADTPGTASATVGIGGQLTAALSASVTTGGFTGAFAEVRVDYTFFYFDSSGQSHLGGGELFRDRQTVGGFSGPLDASADIDQFVGTVLTFPVDVPITVSMTLSTLASFSPGSGGTGEAIANAANTLQFDTARFFDISTAGVTANAGTFLVDNRVAGLPAAAAPAPGSVALLAGGIVLMTLRRRRARPAAV